MPGLDGEALAHADAAGAGHLRVGADAALAPERPQVEAVALDERAQDPRGGGQPVLRPGRDDAPRRGQPDTPMR